MLPEAIKKNGKRMVDEKGVMVIIVSANTLVTNQC